MHALAGRARWSSTSDLCHRCRPHARWVSQKLEHCQSQCECPPHHPRSKARLARPLTPILKDQQQSLAKTLVRPFLSGRLPKPCCSEAAVYFPLPSRVGVLLCIQT
eukprot:5525754-Prymnesium_polylepis.1